MNVAQPAPGLLQVRLQQKGHLTEPGVAFGHRGIHPVQVVLGPASPLLQGGRGQPVGQLLVAGHWTGSQEAGRCLQAVRRHLQQLGHRPDLVAQL